jgi:hypothetical protein
MQKKLGEFIATSITFFVVGILFVIFKVPYGTLFLGAGALCLLGAVVYSIWRTQSLRQLRQSAWKRLGTRAATSGSNFFEKAASLGGNALKWLERYASGVLLLISLGGLWSAIYHKSLLWTVIAILVTLYLLVQFSGKGGELAASYSGNAAAYGSAICAFGVVLLMIFKFTVSEYRYVDWINPFGLVLGVSSFLFLAIALKKERAIGNLIWQVCYWSVRGPVELVIMTITHMVSSWTRFIWGVFMISGSILFLWICVPSLQMGEGPFYAVATVAVFSFLFAVGSSKPKSKT